jgi:hypothetical protein
MDNLPATECTYVVCNVYIAMVKVQEVNLVEYLLD